MKGGGYILGIVTLYFLIKLMSEGRINKTLEPQFYDEILAETSKTIDPSLHTQIKDKYQTFTTFNYRQTYRESRQKGKRKME